MENALNNLPLLAALAAALPFAAFAAIAAAAMDRPRLASGISIAGTAAAFAAACLVLLAQLAEPGARSASVPWLQLGFVDLSMGVLVDQLTALMLFIVTLVSLLVQVYSTAYMRGDPGYPRFFAYLSLFTFSMLGIVVSANLMQIYIFWELVGVSSYLLIGFWYEKPEAAAAAKKAFVVNRVGDFGFLLGILLLGFGAGTFDFAGACAWAASGAMGPGLAAAVALLLFCGALGKSAQFPLHVWLPDAMEGPTPVSALIHAATMVAAGVFMVARLYPVFSASPEAMTVIAYVGGFTALFAATIALVQDDIKRILAYSTLSQLGYMVMALGAGGYTAGLFHLTTHAFFKALLFLGAGAVIHAIHSNDIWQAGGLLKKMPVTAGTMLVATLAIAGVPPLAGFWSKDEILVTLLHSGHTPLFAAALAGAFLTAFYMSRLFIVTFLGAPGEKAGHAHEAPAAMTGPLLVLGFLSAVAGLAALPHGLNFPSFIHFGEPHHPEFSFVVAGVSTAIGLAGIAAAAAVYLFKAVSADRLAEASGPLYRLLKNKYYIDEIYLFFINALFFTLTRAIRWFDRRVVDGVVMLTEPLTHRSGKALRYTVPGELQYYALTLFGGAALALLAAAWKNPGIFGWAGLK